MYVTNEQMRKTVRHAIEPYHHCEKTHIEMVLAHNKINKTCKMILQGMVQGGKRKGRQKKRSEANTRIMDRIRVG